MTPTYSVDRAIATQECDVFDRDGASSSSGVFLDTRPLSGILLSSGALGQGQQGRVALSDSACLPVLSGVLLLPCSVGLR